MAEGERNQIQSGLGKNPAGRLTTRALAHLMSSHEGACNRCGAASDTLATPLLSTPSRARVSCCAHVVLGHAGRGAMVMRCNLPPKQRVKRRASKRVTRIFADAAGHRCLYFRFVDSNQIHSTPRFHRDAAWTAVDVDLAQGWVRLALLTAAGQRQTIAQPLAQPFGRTWLCESNACYRNNTKTNNQNQ